jgi:L-asparaginase II
VKEPIVVEATRGDVVEARHRAHAVAVSGGEIVGAAGDPHLVTYFRSSAKPLQALPVVRARPDLGEAEIAIACASHLARPEQLDAVRALLAEADATEDDLECGGVGSTEPPKSGVAGFAGAEAESAEPTRLAHNCSGKHAGLLALCHANGWATDGYRLPEHPCQRALLAEVAAAAEVGPESMPTAADGCGIVTYALSLERMAHAFSRFRALDGSARIVAAMRAYPELIRGPGAADTVLMQTQAGWFAKGGAEGLLCAGSPDGLGVAVKVEDGATRAVRSALAAFLARLGVDPGELADVPLRNSLGEAVGRLQAL